MLKIVYSPTTSEKRYDVEVADLPSHPPPWQLMTLPKTLDKAVVSGNGVCSPKTNTLTANCHSLDLMLPISFVYYLQIITISFSIRAQYITRSRLCSLRSYPSLEGLRGLSGQFSRSVSRMVHEVINWQILGQCMFAVLHFLQHGKK